MKIKNIIERIENIYPLTNQSSWDNSGVQIGNLDEEIKGVYISLDAELFNIKEAIDFGANLIITHHPFIFSGIKSLNKGDFNYEVIEFAIKNNLTIYSSHTPFDASKLGMKKTPLLKFANNVDYNFAEDEGITFGTIIDIDSTSFELFAMNIIDTLKKYELTHLLRAYKSNENLIKKVAIMGGSGAGYINLAKEKGADLYITSDVKYHDIQFAKRIDLNLIDLSHDQSEMHFVDIMEEEIKKISSDIKIKASYKTISNH